MLTRQSTRSNRWLSVPPRTSLHPAGRIIPRVRRGLPLLVVLLSALVSPPVQGSTSIIQVDTESDQFGSGAACSLREALRAAELDEAFGGCSAGSGHDVIELPAGTFQLSIPGRQEDQNATGDLDVDGLVTIAGAGPAATIIDGGGLDRVIDAKIAANATIKGVTVRGGRAQDGEDGAGIRNTGTLVLASTEIVANHAHDDGGGLLNSGPTASVTVRDSAIIGNVAQGVGDEGLLGGQGGGFRNFNDARALLVNVTVSGNVAESDGGGVDNSSGTTLVASGTVTGNTADSDGDGGGGGGTDWGGGTLSIRNTIVAGNTDGSLQVRHPDCEDQLASQGFNVIGDGTGCIVAPGPGDQIGTSAAPVPPGLAELANNGGPTRTHALLPDSPAIDAGNPAPSGTAEGSCPPGDQRGAPRPDRCDVGAYERVFCLGQLVNVVGTEGPDTLQGTPGDDGVLALGDGDRVGTQAGHDRVCGGGGSDRLRLGGHADVAQGQGGPDLISGSGGADHLSGGGGADSLRGGSKPDTLVGQGGNDLLNGGPGRDRCRQGPGRGRAIRC
jgi:hypothetical protein